MADSKGKYRDNKAPGTLRAVITDDNGIEWGRLFLASREFSTGSVGFFATGKLANPSNPEARYQTTATFTLIGSK